MVLNTDQKRHPRIAGAAEYLARCAALQACARIDDDYAVGQAPRFGQIVRYQDHGHCNVLAQAGQLGVKRLPCGRVDG